MNKGTFIAVLLLAITSSAFALEPRSEHTFALGEGEAPPDVGLEAFSWIVGSWTGDIFGEKFEEVWNPPSAGSMVGMFKVIDGDEVNFYELQLITDDGEGMALLVKHFSKAFEAWEEKANYVRFPFIGIEDNAIHFGGISFYRLSNSAMEAYILLRYGDDVREEKITYQRQAL